MGIKAGELDVNTKHIDELTKQIKNNDDCEVLNLILDEHLKALQNLFDDIQKEQAKLLKQILPILSIPGANPVAIVKWITKLVTGLATPQLEATIKYTKKVAKMAISIAKLVDAVQQAVHQNPFCGLGSRIPSLHDLQNQLEGTVIGALQDIDTTQNSILNLVDVENIASRIDTSSPGAFLNTVDDAFDNISQLVNQLQNEPLEEV